MGIEWLGALLSIIPQMFDVLQNLIFIIRHIGIRHLSIYVVLQDWSLAASGGAFVWTVFNTAHLSPPFWVILFLAALILPSQIRGIRIARRNSPQVLNDLLRNAIYTWCFYYGVMLTLLLIVFVLNPSAENMAQLPTLLSQLAQLATPFATWAVMTGIVAPMAIEACRNSG